MATHFGKDLTLKIIVIIITIILIADPQISTTLWLTSVESKANFKRENIIAEESSLCCNTNSGR